MRRYRKSFTYLLCLLLLAAGCGGRSGNDSKSGGGEEQGELPNATELVTKDDAQRVLGVGVRRDAEDNSGNQRSCFYGGTNVAQGNPSSLSLNLISFSTDETAKTSYENIATRGPRMGSVEPILGLGDEAQLSTASPATMIIHVRKKRIVFYITAVGNASEKPSLNELKSLAKRVAGQL